MPADDLRTKAIAAARAHIARRDLHWPARTRGVDPAWDLRVHADGALRQTMPTDAGVDDADR